MSSEIFYVVGHQKYRSMLFVGQNGYENRAEMGRRFNTAADAYAKMSEEHFDCIWAYVKKEPWKVYRIKLNISEVVPQVQRVGSV